MPNSFAGMNLASNALRNFQLALDTTGHNVANVNTPGYSRQTVTFTAASPTPVYGANGMMSIGGGVTISNLNRIRDSYLDVQRRAAESSTGQLDTLNQSLGEVQGVFQDVNGTGTSDAMAT